MDANRGRQLDLLKLAAGAPKATQARTTASRNKMGRQLGALAASDPSLALRARASGGEELMERAQQARLAEELMGHREQTGLAGQVRGQDLRRAGMEQRLLGQDIQGQAARERQGLDYNRMALEELAKSQDANVALELLQAQANQGKGIDFMRDVFPGLMNMGATGLGAYAMQPDQKMPGFEPGFDKWLEGIDYSTGADLGDLDLNLGQN
jgi:hypothetical protein